MSMKRIIVMESIYALVVGFILGFIFDNILLGLAIGIGIGGIMVFILATINRRNLNKNKN
ncbi:hypothetical protein [Gracilibacillus kekensis]|uniref:Uncharacterized protein n=1 Tax=Gracilibacillus kekensis TaxID=1027249 RepID=A0A1M7P2T0_9BACI|nr:hypothetical protein [Gracilibacillus kekensis]SHN10877.1 hypothetical protein SAMN05216179_1938 [Gracilibacillus kekensis]